MESQDERKLALQQFLARFFFAQSFTMQSITPAASFRRYFRIQTDKGSFVAMDAPPATENCRAFVAIADALRNLDLQTPQILAQDLSQGFLLLSDFGEGTYIKVLNGQNATILYEKALQVLSILQNCRMVEGHTLPHFDAEFMWQEWRWHKEWFADKLLGVPPKSLPQSLEVCFAGIVESGVSQPQVFMHRDYHSGNLMVLPNREVGLLDFQGAFIGPVTYDLVSLLRDCYIDWPESTVTAWVSFYQKELIKQGIVCCSERDFLRWFDWMGIQRHLKALFTFARKALRDQQEEYLQYVPRTLRYLERASAQYTELGPLNLYITQLALPAFKQRMALCAL